MYIFVSLFSYNIAGRIPHQISDQAKLQTGHLVVLLLGHLDDPVDDDLEGGPHLLAAGNDLLGRQDEAVPKHWDFYLSGHLNGFQKNSDRFSVS